VGGNALSILATQSFTKAATSPSRSARTFASRISVAGDCEQPVKIRNPKAMNIHLWRFMFLDYKPIPRDGRWTGCER
jgi:hypothetical protein